MTGANGHAVISSRSQDSDFTYLNRDAHSLTVSQTEKLKKSGGKGSAALLSNWIAALASALAPAPACVRAQMSLLL